MGYTHGCTKEAPMKKTVLIILCILLCLACGCAGYADTPPVTRRTRAGYADDPAH